MAEGNLIDVPAEHIIKIGKDERYVIVLPNGYGSLSADALIQQASEIIDEWWRGTEGQTPILLLPHSFKLVLVRDTDG